MPQSSPKEAHQPRRRWRIPPALLRNPATPEAFEGAGILAEFRGDSGFALFQCYRDVLLWASTPPEERVGLFHDGDTDLAPRMASEHALVERLDVDTSRALHRLRRGVHQSHEDDGSMVADAMAIAAGAERRGAAATSAAYAQLSAAIAPSSANTALAVGRLALRLEHTPVADTWLRRAIALARRSRDWESYAAALAVLGHFREQKSRLDDARGEYLKALRVSRRFALQDTRSQALSGLLRVALRQGDQQTAERYAGWVLSAHRRGHPRRASVLLDVAEVDLRRGAHERAELLLRAALPGLAGAEEVRALILLVRALGGVGEGHVEYAWHRALDVIDDEYGRSGEAARWLLRLALAGAEVQLDAHADRAAQRAIECARQAGDEDLVAVCNAFLARARPPRAA